MPRLPAERPELHGGAYRDIKRTARADEIADVASALAVGIEHMEHDDPESALPYLEWAQSRAPRSAALREALGIALYRLGRFDDAQRELLTYRRITGRADQNHLLADCARATGRADKVVGFVDELRAALDEEKIPPEPVIEGVIVYAGMRADEGDYDEALVLLESAPLEGDVGMGHVRAWYAAGEIATRAGYDERAREYFEAAHAVDDGFLDLDERVSGEG